MSTRSRCSAKTLPFRESAHTFPLHFASVCSHKAESRTASRRIYIRFFFPILRNSVALAQQNITVLDDGQRSNKGDCETSYSFLIPEGTKNVVSLLLEGLMAYSWSIKEDSGWKVNVSGRDSNGHCEKKSSERLSGWTYSLTTKISGSNCVRSLFLGLDEK